MTNREKYSKQLMKIALSRNNVAVVNGVPVRCTYLQSCRGCEFAGSEDCAADRHAWLDADAGDPMDDKVISIADLKDAYIQTVNDVISGIASTGDEKTDMSTLYGAWALYRNIIAKTESEEL